MILRFFGFLVMFYALGFLGFAISVPGPLARAQTDAVIVPTGGAGRIERGLEVLRGGQAKRLFVSGVDREVQPDEFAAEFQVTKREMKCCVKLGFLAVDTRTNANEAATWMARNHYHSVRLVTTDWHMRRASAEFRSALPADTRVVEDAVPSDPSLDTLFLEYNKLLASLASQGLRS